MIEKVVDNGFLNSPEDIRKKLDYYRSLFNKTHDLPSDDLEKLIQDIKTFFNLKAVGYTDKPPTSLIRISNNNRILASKGKELSYLTDISQLLAPPVESCNYNRCNIKAQQILYCAKTKACAYWEAKPRYGDVITLSHFQLKPNTKVNCNVVRILNREEPKITDVLQEAGDLLEEFLIDAFSLEVSRERPKDYLFSSVLASEQLFYSNENVDAFIYPSVQKNKFGANFAIKNDLIFEKYNLIHVETKFILDEFENINPETEELTTDNLISSFATETFDFVNGKILYNEDAEHLFKLSRTLQTSEGKQVRYNNPGNIKNMTFNLSANRAAQWPASFKSKVK